MCRSGAVRRGDSWCISSGSARVRASTAAPISTSIVHTPCPALLFLSSVVLLTPLHIPGSKAILLDEVACACVRHTTGAVASAPQLALNAPAEVRLLIRDHSLECKQRVMNLPRCSIELHKFCPIVTWVCILLYLAPRFWSWCLVGELPKSGNQNVGSATGEE